MIVQLLSKNFFNFLKNNQAISAVEYGLVGTIITTGITASAVVMSDELSNTFDCVSTMLETHTAGCNAGGFVPLEFEDNFDNMVIVGNRGFWDVHKTGQTIGDGWVVISGTVDAHAGKLGWHGGTITNHIDLDGNSPGGIAKEFDTVAGQKYTLTFNYAKHPSAKNLQRDFTVGYGDESEQITAKETTKWQQGTIDFVATESKTQISFNSLSKNGSIGVLIDNVKFNSVE